MLKLIDIDAEEYYNNAIQAMEIAAGEPLYPGDERRVFTEALVAVLVGIANKCKDKKIVKKELKKAGAKKAKGVVVK